MQWDDSPQAGFTTAPEPWIKVNPNYPEINVARARRDPDSIYHFYRRLLHLRKEHLTWVYGQYEMIDGNDEQLYAYRRRDEQGEYFVYLNFSEDNLSDLPGPATDQLALLIGNYPDAPEGTLRPWEARVYRGNV
jgi:glycosidase